VIGPLVLKLELHGIELS